ncbi:MAG: Holliday junction branch migration protein RuvA [Erysipelotrichales bacterium]|nr:Holliday junction branch migration protein RuvA [Erysipelotrichales bacterium]
MYAFISGTIHSVKLDEIIVNNHGIGYRIHMANTANLKRGEEVFVYVYEQILEDAHTLYGFINEEEYDLFMQLIKVKGVGCRTANQILGGANAGDIVVAIENGDIAFMKKLPGIGAKTAQQIILDLKGKLVHDEDRASLKMNPNLSEVEQALKSLGYKASEINPIIKQLPVDDGKSVDQLIKLALSLMLKAKGG